MLDAIIASPLRGTSERDATATEKILTGAAPYRYGCLPQVRDVCMIIAPLVGAALVVVVATGPLTGPAGEANLSAQQKVAATEPLVRSATECIVRAVIADPRYGDDSRAALGDLIVDSVPLCLTPVHAMIDAYDRYYGEGSGEAFFMGPYLDVLPKAVVAGAKKAAQ
jgi:hypothetical protein